MYADDLILVSSSISQMQKMVDICVNVHDELDLKINVNKSACIRVGARFANSCVSVTIEGTDIPWASCFTYLGVCFNAGNKYVVDFKSSRTKFYRSFNSIFSKISKANELVIVHLVKLYCVPVLLYGLESLDLNSSQLNSLDFPMYQAMGKLFKTFDKNILNICLFYLGAMPPRFEFSCRKINFFNKLKMSNNTLLNHLYARFGRVVASKLFKQV